MTKKQLIIDSAIELFAEKGFEATSVQQITDRSGISKGAFYLIFKSKEELVLAIIDHYMGMFNERLDQSVRQAKDGEEMIFQYFLTSLTFFNEHKSLALIFLREHSSSLSDKCFERLMHYETIGIQLLAQMLDYIFGEKVQHTKYDLIIIMQSMLNAYITKILFMQLEINYEQLASMLVEKTNVLVEHSKSYLITEQHFSNSANTLVNLNSLLSELDGLKTDVTSPLQMQSLEVLIDEIQKASPNQAILLGVVQNLSDSSRGKWIASLIKNYIATL